MQPNSAHERIIVALDVPTVQEAWEIVGPLRGKVGAFKIGLEAMSADIAHEIADTILADKENVFWDGKWSDIPNTCAAAMKGLRNRLGEDVWAVNVHANAGVKSVQAVVENKGGSFVLGVTVLTSIDNQSSREMYAVDTLDSVMRLVQVAVQGGVDGLISSPQEVSTARGYLESIGRKLIYVTPGVRPLWSVKGDQARPTTPKEAILNGSDYLVIGRPITAAANMEEAVDRIIEEIEAALEERKGSSIA